MSSKFIYIDGAEIRQSSVEPSDEELQYVLDGDLQILKIEGESVAEATVEEPAKGEELEVNWSEVSPQ